MWDQHITTTIKYKREKSLTTFLYPLYTVAYVPLPIFSTRMKFSSCGILLVGEKESAVKEVILNVVNFTIQHA